MGGHNTCKLLNTARYYDDWRRTLTPHIPLLDISKYRQYLEKHRTLCLFFYSYVEGGSLHLSVQQTKFEIPTFKGFRQWLIHNYQQYVAPCPLSHLYFMYSSFRELVLLPSSGYYLSIHSTF